MINGHGNESRGNEHGNGFASIRRTWDKDEVCVILPHGLTVWPLPDRPDTVAFMGANTPETFEGHFGVPMTGAVLNA